MKNKINIVKDIKFIIIISYKTIKQNQILAVNFCH